MGCVQSLFNASKSRSPSPERDFEPPNFETVPVTRQPKKSYNTAATGIAVADDRVYSDVEYEEESDDDISIKCDDFEKYIEDDLRSIHYVEATALTTLAATSSSVAIIGTTAKCKSAGASPGTAKINPAARSPPIRRQRSSSPSPSETSLPPGPRPPLIGSVSQPMLVDVKPAPVRELASETRTVVVASSRPEKETEELWLSEEQWIKHLATKSGHRVIRSLAEDVGPPPPSPSPFSTSAHQWPLQWPVAGSSKKTNLDRIPVGVIEVLDCEPFDQRRPPPTKAQRLPRAQRTGRKDLNIPLPVIHAMGLKSDSLNHEDLFKTMRVQPSSSDKHGFRSRTGTGSSTFDSSSRKPFLRQSNETKSRYTEDEFSAATGWMVNMPVFAKCPPAKSKKSSTRLCVCFPFYPSTVSTQWTRGDCAEYDENDGDGEMDGCRQSHYPMLAMAHGCFGDGAAAAPKSADKPAVRGGKGAAPVDEIQQLSDAVRRALECPVCKELSGAISTCCYNGHGLCDECSYTMNRLNPETTPKCPLCRSPPARLEEDNCSPAQLQPTDRTASDHQSHSPRPTMAVRPLPPPESARKLHEFMSIIKVSCIYRPNGCRYLVYVISAATHESLCPYSPQVHCMVPYCRWSGSYGDTFQHVTSDHQFSAYDVMENQFLMPDLTFGLQGPMRRTYLTRNIQDGNMLYWVCVARTTARSTVAGIQVAVLKVYDPDATTKHGEGPPEMVFRVLTMSQQGWQRQRGRSRSVCWDRMVLDRMTRVMDSGGYREKCITTLHTPPWCTVTVRNNLNYDATITWNSVVR